MQRVSFILFVGFILTGCGASHDTEKSWLPPSVDPTAQSRKTTFETRTDTVDAVGARQHTELAAPYNSAPVRFMVQIGSFREVQFASSVQSAARERYPLPVVNEYNAVRKLYQIRIGFFETEKDATEFLLKLRKDYPEDYKDAWVISLNK